MRQAAAGLSIPEPLGQTKAGRAPDLTLHCGTAFAMSWRTMSGADSARLLFKRRLHHASLRALVYEAVRKVSILDGDRVEIELDDSPTREHEHLLHAPVP